MELGKLALGELVQPFGLCMWGEDFTTPNRYASLGVIHI